MVFYFEVQAVVLWVRHPSTVRLSWARVGAPRTVNRGQKYATFFLKRLKTPHPRFNDGAKPQGALIIAPGVRGIIIELGVRGIGKNWKIIK